MPRGVDLRRDRRGRHRGLLVSRARLLAFSLLLVCSACGRTGLWSFGEEGGSGAQAGTSNAPVNECSYDTDCAPSGPCVVARCELSLEPSEHLACVQEAVACDDGDACSLDQCNPETGACEHERPGDFDGDGFLGVAPRGTPPSCGGDDCDDSDPRIHPGAPETCDGKDENCNGIIDDGAVYVPAASPVRLVPAVSRSQHGGIAFDGDAYGVTYTDKADSNRDRSFFSLFDENGAALGDPTPVSEINADTYAGALAFSGGSFLTAWADARQAGNYEIYATRFSSNAEELQADLRLTEAPDFSLRPVVAWTGNDYVVVWEDHRTERDDGNVRVFGRRLSKLGTLDGMGGEVELSAPDESGQYPAFALGEQVIGVTYAVLDPVTDVSRVMFRTVDFSLGNPSPPVSLGENAQEPSIAWLGDRFVVAWHTGTVGSWGSAILGATVDERSAVLAKGPLTAGDSYARSRTLVSLGDRVGLVWSGAGVDGNYDLYFEILSRDLGVVQARQTLATGPGFSVDPLATLGPDGDIAVLFDENDTPRLDSYFVRLSCRIFSLR